MGKDGTAMKKYQYHDVNFRGTIDRVAYQTTNSAGEPRDKYANVYLPYGYDAADKEKRYNILYLMHGGGGNPDAWLDCCKIKNMLDHGIDAKEIEPLIVVFPSYYNEKVSRAGRPDAAEERLKTKSFLPELTGELLPAVEGKYKGYAKGTSDAELRAARAHRGFGGFSMGSCTTWFVFLNKLAYFRTFVPLSGDSWELEPKGGGTRAEETARLLRDAAVNFGLDYRIFAATGTQDAAAAALTPQIEAMKKFPEAFVFSGDPAQGNLHYEVAEGEVHAYEAVYQYLYHYLPYLF